MWGGAWLYGWVGARARGWGVRWLCAVSPCKFIAYAICRRQRQRRDTVRLRRSVRLASSGASLSCTLFARPVVQSGLVHHGLAASSCAPHPSASIVRRASVCLVRTFAARAARSSGALLHTSRALCRTSRALRCTSGTLRRTSGVLCRTSGALRCTSGICAAHPGLCAAHPRLCAAHPGLCVAHPGLCVAHPGLCVVHPELCAARPGLCVVHRDPAPHISGSVSSIPDSAPHISDSVSSIPDSAPHIRSSAPHIRSSAPHIRSSAPHIRSSAPHIRALRRTSGALRRTSRTLRRTSRTLRRVMPGIVRRSRTGVVSDTRPRMAVARRRTHRTSRLVHGRRCSGCRLTDSGRRPAGALSGAGCARRRRRIGDATRTHVAPLTRAARRAPAVRRDSPGRACDSTPPG